MCRGEIEEGVRVGPRVCGHRSNLPLLKQMLLVVQPGNVRQVDSGDRQCASTVQRFHCGSDQFADRREQYRGIEKSRRGISRALRRRST